MVEGVNRHKGAHSATAAEKEFLIPYIYELSLNKDRILVKVNYAALSEGLITSELFGHEK